MTNGADIGKIWTSSKRDIGRILEVPILNPNRCQMETKWKLYLNFEVSKGCFMDEVNGCAKNGHFILDVGGMG